MDIQDRKKSLTAEELRQRYNLEDISKNKKAIQMQKDAITKLDTHLEEFVEATTETLEELQDQVDGNITTWFYSGVPTLLNEPAVEWTTTEEKNRHLGDLYYDQSTGYAYRFAKQSNQYIWLKLTDSDVTEALRIANEAQDTADNKRRVFTTTPTTPYDVGDLWLNNQDLYVCSTARESGSYVSTDFEIATKYTDDSALTTFINGSYASTIQTLEGQIDGKSETYYQSTDPSSTWTTTTEKDKHIGDLWYNTAANKSYIYTKNGSTYSWQEADGVPQSVYDKIDGKAQIFSSQPTPPYYAKDLWVQGSTGDIKHCVQTRTSGSFNANDWVLSSKYTDDSSLNTFVNVTYAAAMENLTNQIDGKISTWYYSGVPTLSNLPASEWDDDEKLEHTGDLYYDRATGYCYMFVYEDSTYKWNRIEDSAITDALAVANAAQDTADSKRRVFVVQPTPPYDIGDIWIKEDTDLYRCKIAAPEGGSYSASHWILATNYTDDTVALEAQAALDQFKVDVQETYATSADLITTANSINGRVDETYTYITTVETNTNNQIADITNTSQNIEGNNSLYIDDAIQDNVISYSVDGATEQDGTPTPDNPVEVKTIPSIINYLNIPDGTRTVNNITIVTENGKFHITGTPNSQYPSITPRIYTNIPAGTYMFSANHVLKYNLRLRGYDANGSYKDYGLSSSGSTSITITNDIVSYYIWVSAFSTSTTYDDEFTLQIEKGTIAHNYVPYGYWSRVKITGKNIFDDDISNLKYSNSNNALTQITNGVRATFTGTSSSTNRYSVMLIKDSSKLLGKTYSLSGVISPSASNRGAIRIYQIKSDGSVSGGVVADTSTSNTFTFPSTFRSDAVGFGILFYSNTNGTVAQNDYVDYTNIMLEENTESTTYEPYKENQVLIDMSKENLFDKDNPNVLNAYIDGSKKITTSTTDKTIWIPCKPNTTYAIVKSLSTPTNQNKFRVSTYASTPTIGDIGIDYVGYNTGTEVTSTTITTSATANYLAVFCYNTSSTSTLDEMLSSLKIYESNNPTPYYELCKIGDYKDTLLVDSSGNCVINKNVGKRVFNGSESWTRNSSTGYERYYSPIMADAFSSASRTTSISNYFKFQASGSAVGTCFLANTRAYLYPDTTITTASDFKTWLNTHNTDFYYPLATPETINLPNTKIPLFEGINHVTFVDDLETDTSITYYRNTPLSGTYATVTQLNDVSTEKTQEIIQVRNEVQTEITSTQASINVINETIENGVSKVNGTGYTFDSEGLKIEKTNQDVKSLLDNDGLAVSYKGTDLLTVRSNGIEAENMTVRKFYVQRPIRMEKTKSISDGSSIGLGFFYVGEE